MREALFLLIIVIVILTLSLVYNCRNKEGFFNVSDLTAFATDRQKQFGSVGIALLATGKSGAFGNSVTETSATPESITSIDKQPLNTVSMGLFANINTCEAIKTMDCSAFDDPGFSLNCGLCLDVGKNSKNDPIPGGGLVVLDDAKKIARTSKITTFLPNYIPTVGFCPAGKLVTTKEECTKIKRQLECEKNQSFDLPGCSQCYSNGIYSIVDDKESPGVIASHGIITVVGNGLLTINEPGFAPITNITLRPTTQYKYTVQGNEGTTVVLLVNPIQNSAYTSNASSPMYIAGYISDATFKGEFEKDIKEIILTDRTTGRRPRGAGSVYINDTSVTKMAPGFGQTTMTLVATIPFTFVDTTSKEAYLCDNGPFITKPSSVQLLQSDPCYSKGSGPGKYSIECLQNIWLSNGCTQSGKNYPNDAATASMLMANPNGSFRSLNEISNYIYTNALITSTGITPSGQRARLQEWSDASVFCTGSVITNPCENPEKSSGPLSADCLSYLWGNMGVDNSLGATYTDTAGTSLYKDHTSPQFCQRSGTLSPMDENNNVRPEVVAFWQSQGGVDAVKKIMSDLYVSANSPSSTDEQRLPFFTKCYGNIKFAQQASSQPPLRNILILSNGPPILQAYRYNFERIPTIINNLNWANGAQIKFMLYNGRQILAGGTNVTNGAKIVTTLDGVNWVSVPKFDGYGGGASAFYTGIWTGSRWIISCMNFSKNYITETFSSSDGQSWTEMKIGNYSNHTEIAGTEQILVSAGMNVNHNNQPATQHSTDGGKTWTVSQSSKSFFGGNGGLMCLTYNGSLFVGGGCENSNGGPAIIIYSSDGINWKRANISSTPGERIWSIASNGSAWVGTTQNEGIVYSPDGINWVSIRYYVSGYSVVPTYNTQRAVKWEKKTSLWYLTTVMGIVTSSDGQTWKVAGLDGGMICIA